MEQSVRGRCWIVLRNCLICSLVFLLIFSVGLFRAGTFKLSSVLYGWLLLHLGLGAGFFMGPPLDNNISGILLGLLFYIFCVLLHILCIVGWIIWPTSRMRKLSILGIIVWYFLGFMVLGAGV